MTPAVNIAEKAKIAFQIHEYQHDSEAESFGLEAVKKLGLDAERVFKTLVVADENERLAVGIVPVGGKLNLKRMAKAMGAKKVKMAEPTMVERSTGYVLGGVSPLGQKKRLKTVLDVSATSFTTIFVSAGKRGLEIELSPADLLTLTNGVSSEIAES